MNKIKKLYKDFFGLTEVKYTVKKGDSAGLESAKKAAEGDPNAEIKFESELSEAELLNHMEDYRGGVEYVIADPAQAESTANDIRDWAERKGFKVIKQSVSSSGKVGYFYFRLGENPYKESKKIQGYISQLPIVKHFRFNVRQSKPKPQQDSNF